MNETDIARMNRLLPKEGDSSQIHKIALDETACPVTEPAASMSLVFKPGSKIGKYVVGEFLGRGAMGIVYRGFDPLVERDVAIKLIPGSLASDPGALKRFLSEARAVGKLLHSHTVTLYEIDRLGDSYFLAMEFVPGGSLAGKIKAETQIPWQRATRYAVELCEGLAAAHAVGLVHRDIKPENLLLTAEDHIKITDFGLAKNMDSVSAAALSQTDPGSLVGTPNYMSPEQFNGGLIDHRADLYSAGATYYQLLTGRLPFGHATTILQVMNAHCNFPIPDPRVLQPNLPPACFEVLKRAMAKSAEDRYRTAAEMSAALSALATPPVTRPQPSVWLVERSKLQARVFQRDLQELGIRSIRTFANIAETMTALQQEMPTAIISAMHLDDGSGDDLVARIRTAHTDADMFFFLVSSDSQASGPDSHYPGRPLVLPKPVTREMLAEVVRRLTDE